MSNTDLVVVPDAARDVNLSPTQRFETILRNNGQPNYVAPREDGTPTTRGAVPLAVLEHARYLERSRDETGMVLAEQYVAGGIPFTFGYDIPANYKVDAASLRVMLEAAARAQVPKIYVLNFLAELGKMRL